MSSRLEQALDKLERRTRERFVNVVLASDTLENGELVCYMKRQADWLWRDVLEVDELFRQQEAAEISILPAWDGAPL